MQSSYPELLFLPIKIVLASIKIGYPTKVGVEDRLREPFYACSCDLRKCSKMASA